MFKNVASQKLSVFAWDTVNRVAKTGDAANITGKISKDGGAAASTNDTNPTELDATNFPGIYIFDLTQAETNADLVIVQAKSSSTGIQILPVINYTVIYSVAQTGDSYARLGAPAGASVSADIAAIEAQTDDIGAAGAGLTAVPWNAAWDAEVQSECTDALASETYAEPGQGAPAATNTLAAKINYLYKAWRNKKMQDATTFELYNDAGAVVDQKATVSDDGTDYTFGEIVSGA
jgi:hypothetical protein